MLKHAFLINDDDEVHTDQSIQEWLVTATDADIARYHSSARKVNRGRR